jgi:AhpD family alkylhydroperoxidase
MNNGLEDLPALIATKITRGRKKKRPANPTSSVFYLDPSLEDLVRLRVAQIHECEWSMHEQTKKLRARGEKSIRLGLLKEWRTQMIFSDREKAALNLAEVITRDSIGGVPDEVIRVACHIFTEREILCLVLAILAINDWHYLSKSLSPRPAAKSAIRPKSTFRQKTLKEIP